MAGSNPRSDVDRLAEELHRSFSRWVQTRFSGFYRTECWSPAINAYLFSDRMEICFDLAGVDKESIDVRAEPRRLTVRGIREAPEPARAAEEAMRIVSMEVDYGPFVRCVSLPSEVDVRRITAEQVNGLLWVRLPLRTPG